MHFRSESPPLLDEDADFHRLLPHSDYNHGISSSSSGSIYRSNLAPSLPSSTSNFNALLSKFWAKTLPWSQKFNRLFTLQMTHWHLFICYLFFLFLLFFQLSRFFPSSTPASAFRKPRSDTILLKEWWQQPNMHKYEWLNPSQIPSSISGTHGELKKLSAEAQKKTIEPAKFDCRYYYQRTQDKQKKLQEEQKRVSDKINQDKYIKNADGSSPTPPFNVHRDHTVPDALATPDSQRPPTALMPWFSHAMIELGAALDAEENHFIHAVSRWLTPELDRLRFKARPVPLRCTDYAVLLVETVWDPALIFLIRHTFFMLRSDSQRWGLIIFHGPNNERELIESLEVWPGGAGQHIQMNAITQGQQLDMDRDMANKIVLSSALWESMPVEHVLVLQSDAIMRKPAGADIKLWHQLTNQFVYVAAPFPRPSYDQHAFGGNSGATLRKRSAMLSLARHVTCHEQARQAATVESTGSPAPDSAGQCWWKERFNSNSPLLDLNGDPTSEDRWVARELYNQAYKFKNQLPGPDIASKFSVECVYNEDPFFVHKYWQLFHWNEISRDDAIELLAPIKEYYRQ